MADRSVRIVLSARVDGLVAGYKTAERATVDLSKKTLDFADRNQAALGNLSQKAAVLGTGLVAVSALAVKAAMDWESAWAGVTKTVDGTPRQMAAIEDGLRGLAKTLPATHQEIAAVAEAAGQLGIEADSVVSFTKTMLDLGATTDLTSDIAATSIAQLANVMGTSGDEIDNLASTLVALGNDGASTESQIIQMAQRIAGAAKTVGLSEGEVLAFANTVASMGIDVEAGGTAVSTAFATMARAAASGGPKLESFASTAGMSAEAFATAFKEKPAEAMTAFIKGLEKTQQAGGNLYAQLDAVGLSDVRVSQALIGMASSGDLLTDSLSLQAIEWERNTALIKEAEKRYDTTAAKTQMAWNGIKDNAIDAGQAMLPVLAEVAEAVSGITDAFGKLPGPVKGGLGVLAGGAGVTLLAAAGFVKMVTTVSETSKALDTLSIKAPKTGRALGLLAKGTAALAATAVAAQALESWSKSDLGGVNEFTKGLLAASNGSDKLINNLTTVKSGGWFGLMANGVSGVADAFNKAAEAKGQMDLSFAHESEWERGSKFVEQIDSSLTSAIQSGAIKEAGDQFDYLTQATGRSEKSLMSMLPQYKDALIGVELEQRNATDSFGEYAGSVDGATGKLKDFAEAVNGLLDPFLSQDEATVAWRRSIAELTGEIEANGAGLKLSTESGRNNRDAIRDRVRALQASISADAEAGVGQDVLSEKLKNGRKKILDAGVAAGIAKGDMKDYIEQLGLTPASIQTLVTLKDAEAVRAVDIWAAKLRALPSAVQTQINATILGVDMTKSATGGSVVGPGTATSDSIPAMLSNGEHVLTASDVLKLGGQGSVYRLRAAAQAGLLPAFAKGGAVNKRSLDELRAQQDVNELEADLKERVKKGKRKGQYEIRGLARKIAQAELEEARKELADIKSGKAGKDEAADAAEDAASDARSVGSSLANGFSLGDFAGKTEHGFAKKVTSAGIVAGAQAFAGKLKAFAGKLERAKKLGVPPVMLTEIAGLGVEEGTQVIDALIAAPPADIKALQAAYANIESFGTKAGYTVTGGAAPATATGGAAQTYTSTSAGTAALVAFDYDLMAAANARLKVSLNVSGRQAGEIVRAGNQAQKDKK